MFLDDGPEEGCNCAMLNGVTATCEYIWGQLNHWNEALNKKNWGAQVQGPNPTIGAGTECAYDDGYWHISGDVDATACKFTITIQQPEDQTTFHPANVTFSKLASIAAFTMVSQGRFPGTVTTSFTPTNIYVSLSKSDLAAMTYTLQFKITCSSP